MQITGIILAGGKSQRMGTDKGMLEFHNETLLERAVNFCRSFCEETLISSDLLEHNIAGAKWVIDEIKDCGPIGGIYSGLKKSGNDWNFVLSVDAPFVEKDFIEFLYSSVQDYLAVVPVHGKGKEPLIALYHRDVGPQIKFQLETGNYKMQNLLEKIRTNFVESQKWIKKYPRLFDNFNYPEDL